MEIRRDSLILVCRVQSAVYEDPVLANVSPFPLPHHRPRAGRTVAAPHTRRSGAPELPARRARARPRTSVK